MKNKKNDSGLVKNLINVGIFNALMIAIAFAVAFSIGLFPPILLVLPTILALLGGMIFMVMLEKTDMKGVFIISGGLLGLSLITMAPGGVMGLAIFGGGIVAEIVYQLMGTEKFLSKATAYAVYIAGFALGEYIPFVYMQEAYIAQESAKGSQSLEILKSCLSMITPGRMIILVLIAIVAAYLGSLWGKSLIRKHFAKAGLV